MIQSTPSTSPAIECCGVVCDDVRLVEVEGGRIAVFILRQDVKRIILRDGILAPHPVLQMFFGLAFASIGVWLIFTALRRGLFVEVETSQGTKRLAFKKRPEAAALEAFVGSIEQRYGTRVVRT